PPGSGPRHPPAAALSRLCRTFDNVFLRGGGFDLGPHRCGLRTFRAALDADRLDFPDPWHSDGLLLGLLHAWLGWLLVLGSGRERLADAMARGHRAAALHGGDGKAGRPQNLDDLSCDPG